MSNGVSDWSDLDKKRAAILRVLRYIVAHPEAGQAALNNDAAARALFEDPQIGNITVPANARVVMLPAGEEALNQGGSVIIELPSGTNANPTDADLLAQILGTYKYW